MRIGLIYNAEAGDAGKLEELVRAIERHDHDVVIVGPPAHGVEHLLAKNIDAVVAAGGDGTIAATALALRGSPVPLGILPMGTANNVAVSLGIPRTLEDAIALWSVESPRALDTGVAIGSWGERLFIESVGGGLVTHGIAVMDRQATTSPTTAEQLARALRSHGDVLDLLAPAIWRFTIDGEAIEGEYLLLEVLNTSAVGPNLSLAPGASPYDGVFTVVAATQSDRGALAEYLRTLVAGAPAPVSLPTWQATEVTIEAGDRLHVDDDIVGVPGHPLTRIRVEPGAVQVLAPPASGAGAARAAIDTATGWPPAQALLAPALSAWV